MIHTIIFDMAGVLVDVLFDEILEELQIPPEKHDALLAATLHHPFWPEFDLGILSDEELTNELCRRTPELEKEIRLLVSNIRLLCRARTFSLPLVQKLRRAGYHVYILSNFPKTAYLTMLEDGRLNFIPATDGGVISYQVHLNKPDPAIYHAVLNKYGIDPSHAVFIDDRQENVDGAKAVGLSAIRFQSYEQVIHDLADLGVAIH